MSGVSMRVTFDDAVLRQHLTALALARPEKMSALMRDIGEDILGDAQDNIHYQRLVDGSAMPQSEASKGRGTTTKSGRKRPGKTLLDKGNLRDSYTYQLGGGVLEVGSNLVYAAIHHFGGQAGRGKKTTILARPVLGVNAKREEAIATKLGRALLEMTR